MLLLSACKGSDMEQARTKISAQGLAQYVSKLGSDGFMGRKPFTEGEKITVNYLADQLKNIGFEPAFDGNWFQSVPMIEISSRVNGAVTINSNKSQLRLNSPDDIALTSPQTIENIVIKESELVFAGFGIVAPEYLRDDYAGLDVKGKTVVVLINDPGLYTSDSSYFRGREMTYYGRWTYKFEEAARHGAAGVLIIHDTEGAGYAYSIPRNKAMTSGFYIQSADGNKTMCSFTGWLSAESSEKIFSKLGYNVADLRKSACNRNFRGFSLSTSISLSINNKITYNSSTNVAGILKGTTRKDECIVYTAHWDHFGLGEKENGDSIYNGAVDNGTSMAWALEIGKSFAALKRRPQRSVMILFPTAEEQGLVGSTYYTEHPVFPATKTLACFNNDLLLPLGRMKDLMITGYGQSDLDSLLEIAAKEQGRYIIKDPDSQTGMFFRSDHFSFAKVGIPSSYARGNLESRKNGKEWTSVMVKDYMTNKYHRPADNYEPDKWDLEGIAEDAKLAFTVGYGISTSTFFPRWNSLSEFANKRTR